jgi:hypothetical protein
VEEFMQLRLPLSLASFVLIGLWATACGDDPAPNNQVPVLTGPFVQAADVPSGTAVALALEATDADGDSLTYEWVQAPTSPAGTFSAPALPNPTWTAPQVTADTAFQLRVLVTDGKGGSVNGTVTVTVRAPVNRPPTVSQAAQATPASVTGSAPVQLSVGSTDPDGDTLTYAWTQSPSSPAGTFTNASVANPTWTAPVVSTTTTFSLRANISDGRGGSVQSQKDVSVAPPIPQNNPPVVNTPTASATTINEQEAISLSVTATDADGDPLTYAWAQTAPASPMGTFSSTTVANPTWTAPDVTATGTYTLRVTVSDGYGGSAQGSIDITVQKVNQPPTVAASITSPSSLLPGNTGSFSITASDPDGDPLTYSWDQTDPATPGTWVGSRTASSASWYSPVVSAQTSFTLSVSVTDGQSTPVVRTLTFPVTVPNYSVNVREVWSLGGCTGCHGGSGGLDLSDPANLVDVTARAACNPAASARVVPNDPDNSVLIRKMEGTTCGGRMPQGNTGYFNNNPGLLIRVRSWILSGAPAN